MTPLQRTNAIRIIPLRLAGVALAATMIAATPVPVFAQDAATAETRIRKIEAEVRALQRKVFPGGDGRFFEPQIAPGTQAPSTSAPNTTSTTAVTDILVRLDGLEGQLQALTARSEEQANAMSQLEARVALLETRGATSAFTPAPVSVPAAGTNAMSPPATGTSAPATGPAVTASTAPVAAPSATRLAAVQAIAKPQTADAGDDEYSYGFRLWSAGFYPEARQQLTKFVEQYPSHSRISFGRNLLGRAFLDDNLPEEAARWFLRNYQANKAGDRAADSLLYLGASMIAMKDTKRACIALAEFGDTYPVIAAGRLANEYQANRAKVRCN
ncbi:MAG TPA: tetratricopeptide repeat protein [Erythrobacter sp.]|nr:tetratricopeptide repeat protein [Erythrobacter sp.]